MRTKRKGVEITCLTFRVIPDPVADLWRQGKIKDSAMKIWVSMQLLASERKELTFNEICAYCGVSRSTLAAALKELQALGLLERHGNKYVVVFAQGASSNFEPRSSNFEPRSSNFEPRSSNFEPNLSSEQPRELRDIGELRDMPTHAPAQPPDSCFPTEARASADSYTHLTFEELERLQKILGVCIERIPNGAYTKRLARGVLKRGWASEYEKNYLIRKLGGAR